MIHFRFWCSTCWCCWFCIVCEDPDCRNFWQCYWPVWIDCWNLHGKKIYEMVNMNSNVGI